MKGDAGSFRAVMRDFSKHSRQYPTLARDIIAIDGFETESVEFWAAWKDAVLDLASDASDQSHLLTLIKRAVGSFCAASEGARAVSILADLARIVPSSLDLIMKHFEASFPYWKNPQSAPQLQNFTKNALNLGSELPQLLERIIDFLMRKILLIDLSLRPEDVSLFFSLDRNSNNLNALAGMESSSSLRPDSPSLSSSHSVSGIGERYSQEEKARDLEESQLAHQVHMDQIRDYTNKIDLMLMVFFEFVQQAKSTGNASEIGLFILISFEKNVLHAAKPKFIQFIMFYAAGTDNFVADRLLGSLLACIFARDAQLSANTPKTLHNTPAKAKSIRSTTAFLASFVKKSTFLTEGQLRTVNELLLEWIGRKVEFLTISPQNQSQIEISILANVTETHLEILSSYSTLDNSILTDQRLKKAVNLAAGSISHPIFTRDSVGTLEKSQKLVHPPFNSIQLPLSHQFLSNSGTFRE